MVAAVGIETLRERVTIQQVTQAADTMGAAGTESWANIATVPIVWAAVEPLSGREFFEAQRVAADVSHRVRLRYRDDYTTVLTPKHRLRWGSRTLDIVATLEVVPRTWLHVLARERV